MAHEDLVKDMFMNPEKYIMGCDPIEPEIDGTKFSIVLHDGFGNYINTNGTTYLNHWGMKEFDAALKRIAAASNIKTIDPQDDER